MLRRRPTLIEIEETDLEGLDEVREQVRTKMEREAQEKDPRIMAFGQLSARERTNRTKSLHERLGLAQKD